MTTTNNKPQKHQADYTCQRCGEKFTDDYDARCLYCDTCRGKEQRKQGKKYGRGNKKGGDKRC